MSASQKGVPLTPLHKQVWLPPLGSRGSHTRRQGRCYGDPIQTTRQTLWKHYILIPLLRYGTCRWNPRRGGPSSSEDRPAAGPQIWAGGRASPARGRGWPKHKHKHTGAYPESLLFYPWIRDRFLPDPGSRFRSPYF